MIANKAPRIFLLTETNLDPNCYHSIYISLFRGLAALEVAAAHVRAQTLPSLKSLPDPNIWYQGLSFFTGFAHQAVVAFFLLSGWLVGGSLLNKLNKPDVMLSYSIDRITRLWIVLIPSFLMTLCFAMLTDSVDPTSFDHSRDNEYSTSAFFGNLFGLQGLAVPDFGGNFSLWSLTYETWYYVLFPLLIMSFIARKTTTKIVAATVMVILASHLSNVILLYFLVWILGAAFSRIKIDLDKLSQTILFVIFLVIAVFFRLRGSNDVFVEKSFLQDALYSFILLIILSSQQGSADVDSRKVRWLKIAGKFLSQFSFTLYIIHVPLLKFFMHLGGPFLGVERLSSDEPLHFVIYFSVLTGIVLFAYVFYLLFEAHTYKVRRHIKEAIQKWYPGISTIDSAPVPKQ